MIRAVLIILYKIRRQGVGQRFFQPLAVHLPAENHVFTDTGRKHRIVLKHRAETPAQFIPVQGPHVPAADKYMSFPGIVEAHEQVDNGSLPAACGADNAKGTAFADFKIHILQALLPCEPGESRLILRCFSVVFSVAEGHMIKHNVAFSVCLCAGFCRQDGQILLHLRRPGNPCR